MTVAKETESDGARRYFVFVFLFVFVFVYEILFGDKAEETDGACRYVVFVFVFVIVFLSVIQTQIQIQILYLYLCLKPCLVTRQKKQMVLATTLYLCL